nr:hypothetical protein [Tanacetum cinerariifolium]
MDKDHLGCLLPGKYEKSVGEHYSMLRSYGKAILDSNHGSTIKLGVTVSLDGKTYFDRQLDLVLELLEEDLGCSRGNGQTLMSDQHKEMEPWSMSQHQKEIGMAEGRTKQVISAGGKLFEVRSGSERFIVDKAWFETDMYFMNYHDYVKPVHGMNFWPDQSMYSTVLPPKLRKRSGRPKKKRIKAIGEGGSSTRVSMVGRPRKKQPLDNFKDVDVVRRGPVRDEGASRTRGCAIGSRGRRGKRKVGTFGFAKWFGLQDEPKQSQDELEKTQAEPQQTQHEPEQTQVEDQVEQTEDQAEIDLTQVEQT